MGKRRAGLQKKVSAIFDGVLIPKSNGGQQRLHTPAPDRSCVPPKPLAPAPHTPTPPKYQQPAQSASEAAWPKRFKADVIIKTFGQIPWQQVWERIKNKLFAPKPATSSTRQKTMAVLVPVLFIILVFVFIRVFSAPSPKAANAQSFGPTGAVAGSNNIDWQIPSPYPAELRDPMQFGSVTTQAGAGRLIVRGIVYSKDNPSAVISDQIVHEGDKVLGAVVVKINKDSVEFSMNDKKWTQKVQR